jgi:anti-sigma factor RsiW
MKNCWPDGDLRAYVDGELTPDLREGIAAHLGACPACSGRHRELSERSAWVSAVMALSESTPTASTPRRRRRPWRMAVLPLAAALAIAIVMLAKRASVRTALVATVAPPTLVQTAAPVVRPVVQPAVHPAVHRPSNTPALAKARVRPRLGLGLRPAPRATTPGEEFVRLDDDPIETATVVRISADNGALQADLIVGPDGRAHAIRIVRNR